MNLLRRLCRWLCDLIAPEGYQDKDGFHYGKPRTESGCLAAVSLALAISSASASTSIQTNTGNAYFGGTLTNTSADSSLKLWLTFDNFVWTSATVGTNTDLSGNGNHAGTVSGVNRTNSGVPGMRGQAISAQPAAVNGYLQCRSDASLDDIQAQGGGGMSVAFGVLFRSGTATIIAKGSGSGRWDISSTGGGYPFGLAFTKNCVTTSFVENYTGQFFSNRWYHLVLTYDGGVISNSTKLYVDGERILSTSVTTGVGGLNSDAANNLTLLNIPGNTAFNGALDDVRIYSRILSQDEINRLVASSRSSQQFPVTSIPFNATNIISVEGVANGTVFDTTLMTNAVKGATMGTASIAGAAADWTVETSSNMTAFNPITVSGITYTAQSNVIACRLDTGSASSLNFGLPVNLSGTLSGCFSIMTKLRQIPASGANFDVFNVGAPSQTGVVQINEGGGDFFLRAHSVSNGVTYFGAHTLRFLPYQWYDCGWLWDTNNGKFHLWVYNPANPPLPEDAHRLILYSVSPIMAGSNATYLGPINNPHGTARAGLTNYFRFIAWQYTTQTNAAMIALRLPFDGDICQRFALNVLPLQIYLKPLSKGPEWSTTGDMIIANNNLIRATDARRRGPIYVMQDFKLEPVYWRKEWE